MINLPKKEASRLYQLGRPILVVTSEDSKIAHKDVLESVTLHDAVLKLGMGTFGLNNSTRKAIRYELVKESLPVKVKK